MTPIYTIVERFEKLLSPFGLEVYVMIEEDPRVVKDLSTLTIRFNMNNKEAFVNTHITLSVEELDFIKNHTVIIDNQCERVLNRAMRLISAHYHEKQISREEATCIPRYT
jgi:hypothetical protein